MTTTEAAKARLLAFGEAWDRQRTPSPLPAILAAGAGLVVARAIRAGRPRRDGSSPFGRILSAAVVLRAAKVIAPLAIRALASRSLMNRHSPDGHS